jgi:CheY-like chemotaxis protein
VSFTSRQSSLPIRLVIIDAHALVLKGLEALLATEGDSQVVAACTSGEQTLEAVRKYPPEVLVLEVRMRGLDGLAVLSTLTLEGRFRPGRAACCRARRQPDAGGRAPWCQGDRSQGHGATCPF